jgi:hypothetical protein
MGNYQTETQNNSSWQSSNSHYWVIAGHTTDFGGYKAHRLIATADGYEPPPA